MADCPCCGQTLPDDGIRFNSESGILISGGSFLVLPRREMQVLEILFERRGRIVTRGSLFAEVYRGEDEPDGEAVIESHVSKLRKKVLPLGLRIKSERFKGYALTVEIRQ